MGVVRGAAFESPYQIIRRVVGDRVDVERRGDRRVRQQGAAVAAAIDGDAVSSCSQAQLTAAANLSPRQKAEDQYNAEVQQHQKDNSNNQAAIGAVQTQLNEARVTIARLQADNTDLQAAVNTANSNVQLSTSTANKLQEQATQLRTSNDKLAKENEEFGRRNAELTSTLDSLQARQEETQEKLAQGKEDQQKLRHLSRRGDMTPRPS